MKFLFVHQNFPGQFRHLAKYLAEAGHEVVGLGQKKYLQQRPALHPKVKTFMYADPRDVGSSTHHYLRNIEEQTLRGQSVYRACSTLEKNGFLPDVVYSHPAWGESLFLKEIFPKSKHVLYMEFYYSSQGADVGFDPEFPASVDDRCRVLLKNFPQATAFELSDLGIAPTQWQKSQYPQSWQSRILQIHDGINTESNKPDSAASIMISTQTGPLTITHADEVLTFVARNLEPYRGFHTFMRAIPRILELRPKARILIVGGDNVSYGRRLSEGENYRTAYIKEWGKNVDISRVHFLGWLPYESYQRVLQVSSLHLYLTYPFVLSWSLLEAMSSGCLILASDTAPVVEVIANGKNGFLCDFFNSDQLALDAARILKSRADMNAVREEARQLILSNYNLTDLLRQQALVLNGLAR